MLVSNKLHSKKGDEFQMIPLLKHGTSRFIRQRDFDNKACFHKHKDFRSKTADSDECTGKKSVLYAAQKNITVIIAR